MPVLKNPGHEAFAQEVCADPRDNTKAAIRAGLPEKSAKSAASRLIKRPDVRARIAELQGAAATIAITSAVDIAKQLDEDRIFARKCKNASAMVAATMGKAKVLGLVVDKTQQVFKPLSQMNRAELETFVAQEEAAAKQTTGQVPGPKSLQ